MRDLIISAAIVVVLIAGWLVFDSYSQKEVESFTDTLKDDLIPTVEAQGWEESRRLMKNLKEDWKEYKGKALNFLSTEEIEEIDYSLAKAESYVNAEDLSNSAGELNSIYEQINFLAVRERINLKNIL